MAIDGDTVVVGTDGGEAAYVFRTSDGGATYVEVAKLTAAEAEAGDLLGYSVAIDGDNIEVGPYSKNSKRGAAYVFRTTDGGATYDQVATLTAADGMPGDQFGWSVAISGSIVVIGATKDNLSGNGGYPTNYGAAYIFRTSDGGSTYAQVVKLAPDEGIDKWDDFGYSVAVDGNVVVIGSIADQISGGTRDDATAFVTENAASNEP